MKLKFNKDGSSEITVVINEGTETFDFSYIRLIKGLLNEQEVTCDFSATIEPDEQKQILELIAEIVKIAKPDEGNSTEVVEQF